MLPWWPSLRPLNWYLLILWSHYNSFEDQATGGNCQMSCSDLTRMRGYQDSSSGISHQLACLINAACIWVMLVWWGYGPVFVGYYLFSLLFDFNSLRPSDTFMLQWTGSTLAQLTACHLYGTKPPSVLTLLTTGPVVIKFTTIWMKIQTFSVKKIHLKMSAKWQPDCSGLNVLMICWDGECTMFLWKYLPPMCKIGN